MTDIKINKKTIKNNNELLILVNNKLEFYKNIIQKTIIHVQKNKVFDILGISDVSTCIDRMNEINKKIFKINELKNNNADYEVIINNLQHINNELSSLFKNYGTDSLEDLLCICFGNNNKIVESEKHVLKFDLLKKYFHPTSYKVVSKKDEKQKKNDEYVDDTTDNITCFDIMSNVKQFHMKVYGIKIYIYNHAFKKGLMVYGILDDVIVNFLNDKYIVEKQENIKKNLPNDNEFKNETFEKFVESLVLKDYLIYDSHSDIYEKFAGITSQVNNIKKKQIISIVKEFISDELYNKRNILIQLLVKSNNPENQYLAYLLYDLLSNDTNGNVDTQEQIILFDSFPWSIKQYFKQAMKKTVQYTNELCNFDINKIPLEQQICLLKANDTVKEKAMMKLKEVKAKSEDSGSKARQYLDGLLKIPFNVYKKEPILNLMENIRNKFKEIYFKYKIDNLVSDIPKKEKYTSIEIIKYLKKINPILNNENKYESLDKIKHYLMNGDKKKMNNNIILINEILKKNNMKDKKIKYTSTSKEQLKIEIEKFYTLCKEKENEFLLNVTIEKFNNESILNTNGLNNYELKNEIIQLNNNIDKIKDYMKELKVTLDKAVHGHDSAKKQIERIISQWINGEIDGYCFGFEGAPGIGKTSLAKKGLSDCLKDENGVSRPFAMIQMGGDSNGSTLHGHNYTYVGSTWGSIVQILIDKKCMNPIIFIDEVDKISRTEHGKEIVGILTHLLDPAQNDCFQDKYFNGIELDLSKALFILSYNDAELIDKILLDRVHRIKFSSLSLEDKIVISRDHILPDVYKKMGLETMIEIEDDVLKFIIDEYTCESGVRKLKEILFEIIGEINLNVLKNNDYEYELPIKITIEDIKKKYFKDKREIIIRKIPEQSQIGYINGMYATAVGNGGTLPIHAKFFPCDKFLDLKLTGMQQDVMKESMHVSLTVALNLTSVERQIELRKKYDVIKRYTV